LEFIDGVFKEGFQTLGIKGIGVKKFGIGMICHPQRKYHPLILPL
jgi:hypothetical protein